MVTQSGRLTGTFSKLTPRKILVAGDLLLDAYTIGKAKRISPEAPVAVVNVLREEFRPGGAGNVLLNLISMGCSVVPIGRIGNDAQGRKLLQVLEEEEIPVSGIFCQEGYATPVKNRIIADNQQIVRVDHEWITELSPQLERQVIDALPKLMEGISVVAISDYGKGFLGKNLLQALIQLSNAKNIPVIADPKGIDFSRYRGATIIKPNLGEAYAAANLPREAPLEHAASRLLEMTDSQIVMVTRSEEGISLFHKDGSRQDFPVKAKEVKDVTGAGDTVLAMFASSLASGLTPGEASQLSNIAAGIAIERFGCARVSLSDLAHRLLEQDVANKVFDEEHLFALQQALNGQKFVVLGISTAQGLTSPIFSAIRKLGQMEGVKLLVYLTDAQPDEESVALLSSLHDVDYIMVKGHNLLDLCSRIQPSDVYQIKGNKLAILEGAAALV